jgi:hypothetical protein
VVRKDEIDVSNVRITFNSDGPPITDWLRKEIKQWMSTKCGVDVEVELNVNSSSEQDAS